MFKILNTMDSYEENAQHKIFYNYFYNLKLREYTFNVCKNMTIYVLLHFVVKNHIDCSHSHLSLFQKSHKNTSNLDM